MGRSPLTDLQALRREAAAKVEETEAKLAELVERLVQRVVDKKPQGRLEIR